MIYKVTLNGKIYEVEVEKGEAMIRAEYDAAAPVAPAPTAPAAPVAAAPVAAPAAAPAPAAAGEGVVQSPMPGNINAVKFSAGQSVKAGDVIIILEAMKMENEIVAPKAGTLKGVFVTKGATVNTGDALFEIA